MKVLVEKINQILAEWDPIGVGKTIATDEYRGYIPIILLSVDDTKTLMHCLSNILNNMGLDYDPSNESHVKDLMQVCDNIIQVYNENRDCT
jgi:hypothetical protein